MLPALVVGTCHSKSVMSALGPFVAKPCTNTVYVSAIGLFTLTISSESPSAACPTKIVGLGPPLWRNRYTSRSVPDGVTKSSSMPVRSRLCPAGTVKVFENVPVATAGSNVWSGSCATLASVSIPATSPRAAKLSGPGAKPVLTEYEMPPASPVTSAGAATATGRMATGMRTTWPLSPVHLIEPVWNVPRAAAAVRVNVTDHGMDAFGLIAKVGVDGVTVIPVSPSTEKVYVSDCEPTLFAVLVTACDPARSPIEIEARLRLLGSIEPNPAGGAAQSGPVSWPVPQMNAIHSAGPESNTRPGSAAFRASTWPAP